MKIKVFKSGPHAHRTPLSYPALAPLFADFIDLVERPEQADLYVFSHPADVGAASKLLIEDWRRRRRPVVILSEEPFWDTLWGRRPLARHRVLDSHYGALPVIQLNHHTSSIFCFDRIPYYLLTNHRFANTYAVRFSRNAGLTTADWEARFAARKVDLAFMFERRPDPVHNMHWPAGGIIGLCAWRTALAETCSTGTVERLGASWQGGPSRFELDDWYLDKITRLDDRSRLFGAFENTHQPTYITEKFFDAFACGALPLYFASPLHRIHDFSLPPASWVNLYNLSVPDAIRTIEEFRITRAHLEAYVDTQQRLKRLFCDTRHWVAERQRLRDALHSEFIAVLDAIPVSGVCAPPEFSLTA